MLLDRRNSPSEARARLQAAALVVSLAVTLLGSIALSAPAAAQDLRADLFSTADSFRDAAIEARADVLAPDSFEDAQKLYDRAEDHLERGRDIESIQEDLADAVESFKAAIEATKLAKVTLADAIGARDDAETAEAARYAAELWEKAEQRFGEAARSLEGGNVNRAKKRAEEAVPLFRDAELNAIKSNFFDETRALLERARKDRTERYAPETLARSQDLLSQAEAAIEKDRYDTDLPRTLASEAKYEANHAFRIAELARGVDADEATVEQIVLDSERPLEAISGTIDIVPRFSDGYELTTNTIIQRFEGLRADNEALRSALAERERAVEELEGQIAGLEEELGGASEEHQALQRRMEAEAAVRERFDRIQKMFDTSEARVLREGNDVIVRVVGLQFDSGKAVIQPQYFSLLTKVQDAVNLFPGCSLLVEGHTDSYGTDEMNLTLSEDRAAAVREYLLANMRIDPERVTAVGRGESEPIANNETADGRARNRRIDVVITPDMEALVE